MADSAKRSSSARSKSSSPATAGKAKTSSAKRATPSKSPARSTAQASGRARANGARSRSRSGTKSGGSPRNGSRSSGSGTDSSSSRTHSSAGSSGNNKGIVGNVTDTVGTVAKKAAVPVAAGGAAAVGLVGGIVLGSRVLTPRKKILGIPVARKGLDLKPVAKEIQRAGSQLGRLSDELAQTRNQAKKVGDALS
jgi:hypothetical protein